MSLQEKISELLGLVTRPVQVLEVHRRCGKVTKLFRGGDLVQTKEFDLDPPAVDHEISSLVDFTRFMALEAEKYDREQLKNPPAVVFVEPRRVMADLAYGQHQKRRLALPLNLSESRAALEHLFTGVDQKTLWRMLIGPLAESIRDADRLAAVVSQVQVASGSKVNVQIDPYGLETRGSGQSLVVQFTGVQNEGVQQVPIDTEWYWEGWIWDGVEEALLPDDLVMRLEITSDLTFRFHPRNLPMVERNARDALVGYLRTNVACPVYQGEYVRR